MSTPAPLILPVTSWRCAPTRCCSCCPASRRASSDRVFRERLDGPRHRLEQMDALPFSREELLRQTAWLHSLARQLAMQPSDADDAAQQTWVQALRVEPRGVRAWGPFLATALRNVVALTNRAERRRVARQAASAPDGAGHAEGTADLVARIELHRHLAALVLQLPEPQRELVLRHYFAGDSIGELAERSGLTAAAVRGYLHRARGSLRERL